jgi:hypothetical protein
MDNVNADGTFLSTGFVGLRLREHGLQGEVLSSSVY